jgi:hypothetical protein
VVCLDFAHDQPVTVYLGVAIWMDGPSSHDEAKDDEMAFNHEVLSALGLRGSWTRKRR